MKNKDLDLVKCPFKYYVAILPQKGCKWKKLQFKKKDFYIVQV